MSSLLEINEQFQKVNMVFHTRIKGRNEWYDSVDDELFNSSSKIIFSYLKYSMRLDKHKEYDLQTVDVELREIIEKTRSLSSYSQCNIFVWLKRHLRLVKKYRKVHQSYVRDFHKMITELNQLIEKAEVLTSSKKKR